MKRLLLPLLLIASAGTAWAVPWFGFDTPTSPPLSLHLDTSLNFKDNLVSVGVAGQTTWTNARSQDGVPSSGSVVALINFDNRNPTANQPFWGVSDALSFQTSGDMSAVSGLLAYVFVESTSPANGNPAYPLYAKFYIKIGPGFTWFNGAVTPIPRNQWTKVFINFNAAFDGNGVGPQVVPPALLADNTTTKEVGFQFVGADYDHGTAKLYVDTFQIATGGVFGDDQSGPLAPGSPSASNAGTGNQVNLSWTPSASADADHYNVYRSTTPGFSISSANFLRSVNGAASAGVQDVSVVDGLNYRYRVTAVDRSGVEGAVTAELSATPSGPAAFDLSFKGMTYVAFSSGSYLSFDSMSSLDDLMSTGADYVALVVTQYMTAFNSVSIAPDPAQTPTDAAVVKAIQDIHARGMKVLLKPHVDVTDGAWRGAIHPTSQAAWFVSYGSFINHYADIAQANGVELLCVGTELKTMTDAKFWGDTGITANWVNVINNVRTHYAGPLTYAANTAHPQDEFAQIEFWDKLDFVGLNTWWKLTSKPDPTVGEIKAAWTLNREGFMPLQSAADWKDYTGKNIIVTELGSRSSDGTNMSPPDFSGNPPVDLQEQDDMYQAGFSAWNHRTWVKGLFWWHWDPNPNGGGKFSNYFVPNDKPALQTITQFYGGENTGQNFHYNFEASTQEWTADYTTDFKNNLSTPTATGAPHGGAASLSYPLSFDDPASGDIGDFAFVQPRIRKDLSGYKGLKMYVRLPPGVIANEANNPLKVALVLQTGSNFDWYESNTPRYISSGQWREVSIDFNSAKRASDQALGQPVTNLNDIRRIGLSIFGAGAANGVTTMSVDDVVARATFSVLAISLNTTDYFFPKVDALASTTTLSSIDFENSGNVRVLYKMRVSPAAPQGWVPSVTNPGPGQFIMNGKFNSVQPPNFMEVNHALTLVDQTSSSGKFNGDETGFQVLPGDIRNLWLQFRAPTVQSNEDVKTQIITLSVTSEVD